MANETRARALEFCKFLEIFGRLKGEELGTCFSTVGTPAALFRFTSNRFQVLVDFWSNFWVFKSAIFGGLCVQDLLQAVMLVKLNSIKLKLKFKKSILDPMQCLEHLGLEVDFLQAELRLPTHKRKDFRREIVKLLRLSHATPRKTKSPPFLAR